VNYPNLTEDIFKTAATTYFTNSGSLVVKDGKICENIGPDSIVRYPNITNVEIYKGIYVKSNHFNFWNIVSPYLPHGCYISHAYVSPENQARIGVKLFLENYPTVDVNSLILTAGSEQNPELIGKYQELYLFQLDYIKIKGDLASKGIIWSLPNTSVHQRGLALDITFKKENYTNLIDIIKWFYNNNNVELGLSGVFIKQSETELHIEFVESTSNVTNFLGNSYFMMNGINSPVSQFLADKDRRFYEILKKNGHVDLVDTGYSRSALARMPDAAKRQKSALAKAIREILEEVLGGPGGIISALLQAQLDYSQGLINGLMGALSVVADELDTLSEGRASILIREAIESEIAKTSDNALIRNKTLTLTPLTVSDTKALMVREQPAVTTNKTNIKKQRIAKSDSNRAISKKEPKTTPLNTEPTYDSLRIPNGNVSEHILPYDHFDGISTEFVINLEKTTIPKYTTTVNSITSQLITHNLNSDIVKAYAIDSTGTAVVFSQITMDKNSISIGFNTPFSGTIEVY